MQLYSNPPAHAWKVNKLLTVQVFRLVVQFRVHISRRRTPTGPSHVAANSNCATPYDVHTYLKVSRSNMNVKSGALTIRGYMARS